MTKSNHRFLRAIGSAIALTLTIASSAAVAAPEQGVAMQTVKYGDLNLNSQQGVSALYKRIHVAALNVCDSPNARDLGMIENTKRCVQSAEAGAVRKVNAPQLTAWYQQKTGLALPTIAASN